MTNKSHWFAVDIVEITKCWVDTKELKSGSKLTFLFVKEISNSAREVLEMNKKSKTPIAICGKPTGEPGIYEYMLGRKIQTLWGANRRNRVKIAKEELHKVMNLGFTARGKFSSDGARLGLQGVLVNVGRSNPWIGNVLEGLINTGAPKVTPTGWRMRQEMKEAALKERKKKTKANAKASANDPVRIEKFRTSMMERKLKGDRKRFLVIVKGNGQYISKIVADLSRVYKCYIEYVGIKEEDRKELMEVYRRIHDPKEWDGDFFELEIILDEISFRAIQVTEKGGAT